MSIIEQHTERLTYIEEVAAYIRVSSQEQKLRGLSLAAQVEKLVKYAEEHNMKIVEWYKDEGVSGQKEIRKRPELQRMIHDAEKGRFKRIIFIKLDRFFRSVAEYHECMKSLTAGGVIWTATEEKYDLSTASGKAFVNMKLTMAQFEAEQDGERVMMVNEYKINTGQPLFGTNNMPLCFEVRKPEQGERHKYIGKRNEELTEDLIAHVMVNHSVHAAMSYINNKYGTNFGYNAIMNALRNEMLCGAYRGNPNYCPPYITREDFDNLQKIISRNPRTTETRAYIFTGLIKCPYCGSRLSGSLHYTYSRPDRVTGKRKRTRSYNAYRCNRAKVNRACSFQLCPPEEKLEEMMLNEIDQILANKKAEIIDLQSATQKVSKYNLTELQQELDRLNYSWQKGRIKTVEEYDEKYDKLTAKIEEANSEQSTLNDEPDYDKIQQVLSSGWQDIYKELDAEHKRAFWRSFIEEIIIEWDRESKRIVDVTFF